MTNSLTPDLGTDWDFHVGADGNLKMKRGAEGIAQNVACEGRCYKGGCCFFQEHGIDWLSDALGLKFQKSIIAVRLREAAQAVQGVKTVESIIVNALDLDTRTVTGEIQITTEDDENVTARI